MIDLSPSNELVKQRGRSLETKVRRLVALVAALGELACLLPSCPETEAVQSIADILADEAPSAAADVQWLMDSLSARTAQLDAILLKSVA